MPRLVAIGDIHGCSEALEAVLRAVEPRADDRFVFLGDYVDRGPDSRAVIDTIIELKTTYDVVTLLGNHEEMMLRVLRGEAPASWWLRHGGVETLDSYGFTGDMTVVPIEHVRFLEACPAYFAADGFFFVHANYVASEPLESQPVEALRWQSLAEYFPGPHVSGATAIIGHSAQQSGEVLDAGHLRCLDTGCYAGGWLTAMDVLTGDTWQADRQGQLR